MNRAPLPPEVVAALLAHQRAVGAGPAAERAVAALAAGAPVVATGQQPGLLGGPLLALHKALGALAEAAARGAVAVFWVAADDHDWDEGNDATVFDAAGQARALALGARGDGRSVGDVPLGDDLVAPLLDALAAALPATDRGRAALETARPGPLPTDLGTWFTTVLARALGDVGLVYVTPRLLAPASGPWLAALVERGEPVGAAVRAEGVRRRAAGRGAPLDPRPDEAPLFLREADGGPRRRVGFRGDAVTLRGEPSAFTRASLAAHVRAAPARASADVVGRVLLQDALFPVVAIVAGPTEAAYLAQVAPAHDVLGLPAPEVRPRPSAAWLDPRAVAALEAAGVAPSAVVEGAPVPAVAAADAGTAPADPDVARLLAAAADAEALRDRWSAAPGAARALSDAGRALRAAADAWRRAGEAETAREASRRARAAELLRPRGRPQERTLCLVGLLARHGLPAVRAEAAALDRWRPGVPFRLVVPGDA